MADEKRTIIGLYPGEKVNAEDVATDAMNYRATEQFKQEQKEGFTYVGSFDKNSTPEDRKAIIKKAVEMHEKHVYGYVLD